MLHKIIFIIPTFLFLLPLLAQMIQPIQSSSVPNVAKEKEPLKALKMIGPEPLAPGQKGTIKTAYFDPKTYSTKDLGDFHRLTLGLNADIHRMVEEMERLRKKSIQEEEELNRLRQLANPPKEQSQSQWLLLLLISVVAMAMALMALALTNLILIKLALKSRSQMGHGPSKATLLANEGV